MTDAGYIDDPTIRNDSELWRRIPPQHFIYDDNLGRMRPSSAAFDNHPNGSPMSVVLAEVLAETGDRPDIVLAGHEGYALASIAAGLVRECGQGVAREPLPEQPAHAVVFGKKTGSVKRRLAKAANWVIPPPTSATNRAN